MGSILMVLAAFAAGSAQAADQGQEVSGAALHEMFAAHEYGDDVHFAYRFLRDGSFTGTEMGKDVRGRWRMRGAQMCWRWTHPPGAEECYEARRNGAEISLYRNGVEQWFGTLKSIDPSQAGDRK